MVFERKDDEARDLEDRVDLVDATRDPRAVGWARPVVDRRAPGEEGEETEANREADREGLQGGVRARRESSVCARASIL